MNTFLTLASGIYRKEIIVDQTFIEDKYLPYYRIGMVCLLLVFCQWGLKAFFFTTMTVFLLKVYFYKVAWVLPISWQKSLGFLQDYEDRFHSVASEPGKFENFERKRK